MCLERVNSDDLLEPVDLNDDEGVLEDVRGGHAAEQEARPLTRRTALVDDVGQTPISGDVAAVGSVHLAPSDTRSGFDGVEHNA